MKAINKPFCYTWGKLFFLQVGAFCGSGEPRSTLGRVASPWITEGGMAVTGRPAVARRGTVSYNPRQEVQLGSEKFGEAPGRHTLALRVSRSMITTVFRDANSREPSANQKSSDNHSDCQDCRPAEDVCVHVPIPLAIQSCSAYASRKAGTGHERFFRFFLGD